MDGEKQFPIFAYPTSKCDEIPSLGKVILDVEDESSSGFIAPAWLAAQDIMRIGVQLLLTCLDRKL
jgi:hypothetical protein